MGGIYFILKPFVGESTLGFESTAGVTVNVIGEVETGVGGIGGGSG